jgi:predicted dehydrogenase
MGDHVGWGILGTGGIAARFATALGDLADARLAAVESRSAEAAGAFGDRFSIPHRHSSFVALVADREVDVVYVATPHTLPRKTP